MTPQMSDQKYISNILFLILIITKTSNTSNVFRSQSEYSVQSSRTTDNQSNGQTNGQSLSSSSLSSRSIYDSLVSIDERLRLLEGYENTYKLNRINFSLEQLTQRIASIEAKLSRLENSFDSKIIKIEESVVSNNRKEEFNSEAIIRKVDYLSDRLESKYTKFETIFEPKINKIIDKLESIERYMNSNSEDITEKLIKYEERHTIFESHVKSHIINIENLVKHSLDANTKIKDIVSYDFESVNKLVNSIKDYKQHQNFAITRLTNIANQIQNSSSFGTQKMCNNSELKIMESSSNNKTNTNGRAIDEPKALISGDVYDNISSTLEQLRQLGVDEKLTQLDVHVDYFSRKIINTIQEIWRSSQSSENYLKEALDMANKTRSFIRQEFNRLQELIGPLTKTPDFSDIREPLEQKLYQLFTTIDDSFNALLISQNSFISSCNRIQEEEEQLYDVLDDMLVEIRNKSSLDMSIIKESINGLTIFLNKSITQLQTQIDSIDEIIIREIQTQIHSNANNYSTSSIKSTEECFLTRSQLISVCNKNENLNNKNTNINNKDIYEDKSEDKLETNYEDLTQTD